MGVGAKKTVSVQSQRETPAAVKVSANGNRWCAGVEGTSAVDAIFFYP
jgi:hypothetical protein